LWIEKKIAFGMIFGHVNSYYCEMMHIHVGKSDFFFLLS